MKDIIKIESYKMIGNMSSIFKWNRFQIYNDYKDYIK
jgi:hypothetical protein